jgi:hypothetical protein
MIQKILILIGVSILLAGCITSQPAEKGTLKLTSSPAGAEIYLDSQYKGTSPSTISDVEPGNHTLEFRSNGYKVWKSVITVPSGPSNYFAALTATAQPGSEEEMDITPAATSGPVAVTVQVSREQMIIGDSMTFSGIATGTDSVTLTLFGPGYYANGIVLDTVKPDAIHAWTYTWNPGTKIQAGTYTIVVNDPRKTVSNRASFTVIGDGVVSVIPSSYAVVTGDSVTFSGRCTTGAPNVRVMFFGPARFASGVDLGTFPCMADQTWSMQYTTDLTMLTGVYSVYVYDVPQTTSGSSQFTIGYAS